MTISTIFAERIVNSTATKITNHRSSLSIYVSLMLYVHTRSLITPWICFNIVLEVGFSDVLGLSTIIYSSSIKGFLNSWPINYDPWWYVIFIGQGYLVNHVVSTNSAIDTISLLKYCVFSNHSVTVSIIVTYLRFKFYLFSFLCIT